MYRLIYSRMRPHLLPVHNPRDSPTSLSASGSSSLAITASPVLRIGSEKDVGMATTRISIPSSIEEISRSETKPLIQRTFSYTQQFSTSPDSSPFQQKRRRRSASDNSLSDLQSGDGDHSFQQDVGRDASDAYVITRLSLTLLRYLGLGYRWISSFLALGCYSLFILPGIVQVGYQYFFSTQIRRGIVYGDQPRNKLDIYLPKNSVSPKPVIAFVTGGAWIIGYKAWGSLLGLQLLERDIIVVCIDYRNFPQGTISHMIQDASQGISFICNHIAEYGGDPERIYLMGQSAGAHIGACVLLDQAIKEASGERISWSVSQIKSYFGLSGGYNLFNLIDHLNNRGLYHNVFSRIMEGEESFDRYSPEIVARNPEHRNAVSLLPPVALFHGTADYSLPCVCSKSFAETLQNLGVQAEAVMYEGKTHTDLFIQDPMKGGRDDMFEDLVSRIHAGDSEALARDAVARPAKRLVPEFMLKLARAVSPF